MTTQAKAQPNTAKRVLYVVVSLLASMGVWIFITTKVGSFHQINTARHPILDQSMKYLTHLGDGLFILSAAVLFLVLKKNIRLFAGIVAGYLLSGIVVQSLKNSIQAPRPAAYFAAQGMQVPQVEGVALHMQHSFPSGHTASAFAFFLFLAFIFPGRWRWLLVVPAFVVAYSRVYLSQHFTTDVLAGACIGTLTAWAMYLWLYRKENRWKALFSGTGTQAGAR